MLLRVKLLFFVFFIPSSFLFAQGFKIPTNPYQQVQFEVYKALQDFRKEMAIEERTFPINSVRFFYRIHVIEITDTTFEFGVFPLAYSQDIFEINKELKYTLQINNDVFYISLGKAVSIENIKGLPNIQTIDEIDTALIRRNIEFTTQKGLLTHFDFPLRVYKLKEERALKEVIHSPLLKLDVVRNWKYLPFTNEAIMEFKEY